MRACNRPPGIAHPENPDLADELAKRVVETGSHEELIARHGSYAELYGIQARGYR